MNLSREITEEGLTLFRENLLNNLKDHFFADRTELHIPDLNQTKKFTVFNCIDVKLEGKIWFMSVRSTDIVNILLTTDSKMSVTKYLESVISLFHTIKDSLSQAMPFNCLTDDVFQYSIKSTLLNFYLLERLRKETNYKLYIDTLGDIVFDDLKIALRLTRGSEIQLDRAHGVLYVPNEMNLMDLHKTLQQIFDKQDILNYINNLTLSNIFEEESETVGWLLGDFRTKFNEFLKEWFEEDESMLNIDYYAEVLKANPNADLKEIYYLSAPLLSETFLGFKAFQGYYRLNEEEYSFTFYTYEEYEKIEENPYRL